MALDKDAWIKRALELKPESRMYINGAYVDSASGKTFDDTFPRDQRVIAKIAAGNTEDVNRAQNHMGRSFLNQSLQREQ